MDISSSFEEVVSLVLLRQEGAVQQSIYFASYLLKNVELWYNLLEKLALALVLSAWKLRPYFLSHLIMVLTTIFLGYVLAHPDVSGRLVKWITKLNEYDIRYRPRTTIKAQALIYFLTEILGKEERGLKGFRG